MTVTGLVLAAGGSRRLGEPKQLLPFRGRTLLDATLDMARTCGFDDILVTLGGSAAAIRSQTDLSGVRVIENPDFATGCGSSISSAVPFLTETDRLVLLLGDQPGIQPADVRRLAAAPTPLGVCRYTDGLGHPFLFHRQVFGELADLHGDKAVWKLLHSGRYQVTEVDAEGTVPIDVDTREDYERLLRSSEQS
ncbi:molybdenum cofactor cytidylyltransferase [Actinoplanes lutulentus]|uniref:Molybdenum cofactor cytidylyltransferase n=1 Tax=Actinoplanes lutulentus TaxID=1287878 RepID=A0A327ZHX5_9ACTN|nr:nucleotidyltransferase family protein [Actinoplanes lutulentus]MBB2944469.1 molybdenum cofactor cytidylyltransferase [Actinoplanes lutulentus]RAK42299.1 molybdenum cofactor cytidylyltransferase [Actinoplanes lutulentus]